MYLNIEKEELENVTRNLFYVYKYIHAAKMVHYKNKGSLALASLPSRRVAAY